MHKIESRVLGGARGGRSWGAGAWGRSGGAGAWGCRHGTALSRGQHWRVLLRSGLWSWAPTHTLICHQQAQGHMSVCGQARGGRQACVGHGRQHWSPANGGLGKLQMAALISREWRRRSSVNGGLVLPVGKKGENNKLSKRKMGRRDAAYCCSDGCSVMIRQGHGTKETRRYFKYIFFNSTITWESNKGTQEDITDDV